MKVVGFGLLLTATLSQAEPLWSISQGQLRADAHLMLGTRSAGLGFATLRTERDMWAGEAVFDYVSRVVEARAAYTRQLTENRFFTPAFSVGVSALLIPETPGFGIGPHVSLGLSIGPPIFHGELGLASGLEFFTSGSLRLPQRLQAGLRFTYMGFSACLAIRGGVDVVPSSFFVGRGEILLSAGWRL
jgi:hypothetical protein